MFVQLDCTYNDNNLIQRFSLANTLDGLIQEVRIKDEIECLPLKVAHRLLKTN
jgi:hypothetical protein